MLTVLCSRASCWRCEARTAGFHHSMTSQGAPMPRTRRPEARNAETSTNRGPAEPRAVPRAPLRAVGGGGMVQTAAIACSAGSSTARQDRARKDGIQVAWPVPGSGGAPQPGEAAPGHARRPWAGFGGSVPRGRGPPTEGRSRAFGQPPAQMSGPCTIRWSRARAALREAGRASSGHPGGARHCAGPSSKGRLRH